MGATDFVFFLDLLQHSVWAMGSIMAAVAVLLIHIERKPVILMNPNSNVKEYIGDIITQVYMYINTALPVISMHYEGRLGG